jgi:O-antigen/teichoic acid export membrane protein
MIRGTLKIFRARLSACRNLFIHLKFLDESVQSALRAGGILLIANGIVTILGLVRTPLVTWLIPKDQVGMMGVVFSWLPFISLLSMPGLDSSTYHYAAKGQNWAYLRGTIHRFRWSLLSALAFIIGSFYWFLNDNQQVGWLFMIAGISFPFSYGMTSTAGIFSAWEKFGKLFWYRLGESLTDFAGFIPIMLSLIWINEGVTFFASNQFATVIMQTSVTALVFISVLRLKPSKASSIDERIFLNYGKHLTALTGISVFQSRVDAFLISIFKPMVVMADYSIALIIQEQLRRLWNIYTQVRYPALVRVPPIRRKKLFLSEGGILWMLLTLAGIAIILLAHWLIPIFLPPNYSSSLVFVDLLVIAVIMGVPGGVVELFYRTMQDEKSQYKIRLIGAIGGIFFPTIGLVLWGAIGVAIGRILSNFFFSLTSIIIFSKSDYHLE